MYVATFNGTIKLDVPASRDAINCIYKIVAAYPNTKVSLKCTTKPTSVNLVVSLSQLTLNFILYIYYRIQKS